MLRYTRASYMPSYTVTLGNVTSFYERILARSSRSSKNELGFIPPVPISVARERKLKDAG